MTMETTNTANVLVLAVGYALMLNERLAKLHVLARFVGHHGRFFSDILL